MYTSMRRSLQVLFLLAGLSLELWLIFFFMQSHEQHTQRPSSLTVNSPGFPTPEKRTIMVRMTEKPPPPHVSPRHHIPDLLKKTRAQLNELLQSETPIAPAAVLKAAPPDFNPAILSRLPQPVKAPADVTLPESVTETGQWIGSQSGITHPMQIVFRNAESWRSFWNKAIAPYDDAFQDVPNVDFSAERVVGVFQGDQPLPGYQIRIESAEAEQTPDGLALVVRYRNIDHFLGIFATRFAVQPFHLLKVDNFPDKVTFIEIKDNEKKESHE
jgi:hypothetical protein